MDINDYMQTCPSAASSISSNPSPLSRQNFEQPVDPYNMASIRPLHSQNYVQNNNQVQQPASFDVDLSCDRRDVLQVGCE